MVRDLFGATPDGWQEEGLAAFPHTPRMCMKACTGPGKLQPKSMEIETPDGVRRWGDIRPGSFVFAEDGSPTRVVQTFDNGVKPVWRVRFDDGSSTLAGAEHLWKVKGRTERRKGLDWSILTTAQIIARGVRLPNGLQSRKQFEIPMHGAVQYPESDQVTASYLVGVWLGDGTKGSPTYCKPYVEVEQEINRLGYRTSRKSDGKQVRILGWKVKDIGEVSSRGSHERFIPSQYKRGSVQQRSDLLRGLMDTDGGIDDDGHMQFASTSRQLAEDVMWLVRSLGGNAYFQNATKHGWYHDDDGNRVDCRDCWRVVVRTTFNPFLIPHKANRWKDPMRSKSCSRYLTRYIESIEPAGEADCMCIEIEHPSRCYLANDFIVTHNSTLLAWVGWNFILTRPHSVIGVTSISADNLKSNLWTELARWYAKSELLRSLFEMTKTTIYAREHPDTWKMEARTWAKDADPSQLGVALRGLHAPYVMWLLDESGDYPDGIMPVCEAIFSGSPKEAHIIQAGNPIKLGGPLYQATLHQDVWKVINITADPDDPMRTPRVSVEHARQQIAMYGRDNPFVRVNIFGEFPPSSLNALIGPDEIMAATRRSYHPDDIAHSARVLGVDVALFGDDSSVVWPRQGLVAFIPMRYRNIDGIQGAGVVSRKWEDWEVDACFVDNTGGFGSSWVDNLRLLGRAPIPVQFSQEPNDRRYYNKRAEMAFDAAAWVKNGGQLPPIETPGMPELLAAMTRTSYTFKGDRLILEPKAMVKAKLGYSPDDFDALILTFAHPVAPRHAGQRRRVLMKAEYDPFEEFNKKPRGGMMVDFDPYGGR